MVNSGGMSTEHTNPCDVWDSEEHIYTCPMHARTTDIYRRSRMPTQHLLRRQRNIVSHIGTECMRQLSRSKKLDHNWQPRLGCVVPSPLAQPVVEERIHLQRSWDQASSWDPGRIRWRSTMQAQADPRPQRIRGEEGERTGKQRIHD